MDYKYAPGPYNVVYDSPKGQHTYCMSNMDKKTALLVLEDFKKKYFNPDGTGKAYPNGKGFYPFTNPRIEKVRA